tara:strand:+ start:944767 stop:945828 length:1062 start_codon:yes stop_codon:yes gene_type:complete
MGAVGDSLLDEHFDQDGFGLSLDYSKNGFELMVEAGKIDAGPTGMWGGTRGSGYEYNWALAGSTTGSLIGDGQHTSLANQVSTAGISHAVMIIGSNDTFPFPPSAGISNYSAIYDGIATQQQIDLIASSAVASVVGAAAELKNSGVNLIVAAPPEYGIAPFTKNFYPDPVKRERVDDVMESWISEAVIQLTEVVGVPVADLYTLTKDIWGDHGSENATFELGGVQLNLNGTGGVDYNDVLLGNPFTPTSDTVDAFVHDGIHPNNVIGGMIANVFMTGFNEIYGESFDLFSEEEILALAGPNVGAMYDSDTFSASLGGKTYSSYIIAPTAIPEPNMALAMAAFGLVTAIRRRRR